MSGFVDRENQIFDILQAFINAEVDLVVVGGYGVSAFQHRFSVDADLVIPEEAVERFTGILTSRGYEQIEDRELDVYGGRYLAYQKDAELPVTIDLLVGGLQCRQTDAAWSYQYFRDHAVKAEIEGSEKAVDVLVPEKELLIAVKLHSGRLTDARDAVALATDTDPEIVLHHMDRGDREKLQQVLEQVADTISSEDFVDAFKGVFAETELPEDNIQTIYDIIQRETE